MTPEEFEEKADNVMREILRTFIYVALIVIVLIIVGTLVAQPKDEVTDLVIISPIFGMFCFYAYKVFRYDQNKKQDDPDS